MDQNTLLGLIAAVAIIVVLLIIGGALMARRRRSDRLHGQFGSEYDRTVDRMGSRNKAEADLLARQKRVEQLNIVPLAPQEAERFRNAWDKLQARFVDSPQGTLAEADLLVRDLMTKRGYPMSDFESRAGDISVDHPAVVEHYRAAHDIALRDREGRADTESLRQAVIHYRALFADLLEVGEQRREREPERGREPLGERMRRGFGQPDRAMARDEAIERDRERHSER